LGELAIAGSVCYVAVLAIALSTNVRINKQIALTFDATVTTAQTTLERDLWRAEQQNSRFSVVAAGWLEPGATKVRGVIQNSLIARMVPRITPAHPAKLSKLA
jgi:hypothetical protein